MALPAELVSFEGLKWSCLVMYGLVWPYTAMHNFCACCYSISNIANWCKTFSTIQKTYCFLAFLTLISRHTKSTNKQYTYKMDINMLKERNKINLINSNTESRGSLLKSQILNLNFFLRVSIFLKVKLYGPPLLVS